MHQVRLNDRRHPAVMPSAPPDFSKADWTETQSLLRVLLSALSADELCGFWRATQAMDEPLSLAEHQRLMTVREQCLDEFQRRVPGQFEALALRLVESPHADPRPYLVSWPPSPAD